MFSKNNLFAAILIFCCAINGCLLKQIPKYISICKRDQATIAACAKASIEELRPKLIEGIPELDVPPIEPFVIAEIRTTSLQSLKAYGRDVKVTGGSNFHIKSISVDLNTFTMRVHVRFPKLHFDGRYKLDTRLLVVPIRGEGTLIGDAVKCDAQLVLHSKVEEKDGKEYLTFTKLDSDVNIKDYTIRLEGLFNGDPILGNATNEALNQNRGEFLRATKPYLERGMSHILLSAANKIVKDLPLDDLLPK